MDTEKVTVEQAVKKLSEANNTSNTRLAELEIKITEMNDNITERNKAESQTISNETVMAKLAENQKQWSDLTFDVRSLKGELSKLFEAITMSQVTKNDDNQLTENKTSTPHNDLYTSTAEESFECTKPRQNDTTQNTHQTIRVNNNSTAAERTPQLTHTIVMPPAESIPTFHGNISDSPRQFLIQLREYAETTNHWDEQSLLKGISQFLRGTALEWYCHLRTSKHRPQTWVDFTDVFLDQFNSPLLQARQEQLWKECKQEKMETINAFVVRLRTLWREVKPDETENDLGRHLKRKIRDDIAVMMGVPRGETLEEIIKEARKAEEAVLQRAKEKRECRSFTQELHHYNANSTPVENEEEQYEVQAISAQQTKQYHNSYTKRPQYTNYSSQRTTYRRDPHSNYDIKCYACGLKGHTRNHCPNQYNGHQRQDSRYYPKNGKGARAGRDRGAPM